MTVVFWLVYRQLEFIADLYAGENAKSGELYFFSTAAEAEKAGYRHCLTCRPELAPGTSITDATSMLTQRAAKILEEHCGNGENLEKLADLLGGTDRHLRQIFMAEYHVNKYSNFKPAGYCLLKICSRILICL